MACIRRLRRKPKSAAGKIKHSFIFFSAAAFTIKTVARRGILDFYPVVFRLSRSFLDSFLGFFTLISWLSKFKYIVFKSSRF